MLRHIVLRIFFAFFIILSIVFIPINFFKKEILEEIADRYHLSEKIKIEGVSGFFPFEFFIEKVTVSDSLTLHHVDVAPSFLLFLTGFPRFNHINVGKIDIHKNAQHAHLSNTIIPFPDPSTHSAPLPLIEFPTLDFLKWVEVDAFNTHLVYGEEDFTLQGTLKSGGLNIAYASKTYHGTVKTEGDRVNVSHKHTKQNWTFSLQRHSSSLLQFQGVVPVFEKNHALKGSIKTHKDHYQVHLSEEEGASAEVHFREYGKCEVTQFTYPLLTNSPLTVLEPITVEFLPHIRIKNITLGIFGQSIYGENLSMHSSLGEFLDGALTGDLTLNTTKDFWKKLHPDLALAGGISLQGKLSGTSQNPAYHMEVKTNQLRHQTIRPLRILSGKMIFDYNNHVGKISVNVDGKHNLKITGAGAINATHEPTLDFKGNIFLNLRHLLKILPRNDKIDGEVGGNFTLQGSLFSPKIKGEITLKKGYFENYIIGTHLQNVQGSVTLLDHTVRVHITGKDDFKGSADISGSLNLFPLKGNLKASLAQFYLGQSDLFTASVTGEATLDVAQKRIHGRLTAHRVVVDLDQLTPSATPKIQLTDPSIPKKVIAKKKRWESRTPNDYYLDLIMVPERDIIVRGFGVQSLWKGSMRLLGKRPDFVGEFTLTRGTIDILDRVLTLSRGKIIFDHDVDRPFLDIDMNKKIQEFDILVNLKGHSNNPQFTFMSTPSLSQEEILGLILLGRRSAGGSIGQLIELSSSLSGLMGQGNENFFTKFRKAFGVEALEIKKIEQDGNTEGGGQALSLRKQLSPKFTLVLEQGLTAGDDDTKDTRASLEANLTDNVNVSVDVSSNKSGGIGLNWVKRY